MAAKPVVLLGGGPGTDRRASELLWRKAVEAASAPHPTFAYVGCASGDSADFRSYFESPLKQAGARKIVPVLLCGRRPDLAEALAALEAADAVFVSGGDVEKGMQVLERTGFAEVLRDLAAKGKPFAGLSAGSLMLARGWVRWRDPENDATAEQFSCLNVAPIYCDAHDEESGWAELKLLLRLLPRETVGWGIPSGGGLTVHPDGAVEWFGRKPARLTREKARPDEC